MRHRPVEPLRVIRRVGIGELDYSICRLDGAQRRPDAKIGTLEQRLGDLEKLVASLTQQQQTKREDGE